MYYPNLTVLYMIAIQHFVEFSVFSMAHLANCVNTCRCYRIACYCCSHIKATPCFGGSLRGLFLWYIIKNSMRTLRWAGVINSQTIKNNYCTRCIMGLTILSDTALRRIILFRRPVIFFDIYLSCELCAWCCIAVCIGPCVVIITMYLCIAPCNALDINDI